MVDTAQPTPLAQVFSGFILGLAIIGYLLFGWSLFLLHTPPTAAPVCAHTVAQTSPTSLQDELFIGITSSIGRQVYHGTNIVDSNTAICVVRASDGGILRRYALGEGNTVQSLIQARGLLYYLLAGTNQTGQLCAMRASSGTRLWCQLVPNYIGYYPGAPLLTDTDSMLYVLGQAQGAFELTAFRASDGTQLWTHPGLAIAPSYAVTESMAYVSTAGGQVCALRASDGATSWCAQLISSPDLLEGIAADATGVYVLDEHALVTALRPADGAMLWQVPLQQNANNRLTAPSLTLQDGMLYVAAQNPSTPSQEVLNALQASTGAALWKTTTTFPLTVTVADGVVYLASNDSLQALQEARGKLLWQKSLSQYSLSRLVLAGSDLYLLDGQSNLSAFDKKDGTLRWEQSQCTNANTPHGGASEAHIWCNWGTDRPDYGLGWSVMTGVGNPGNPGVPGTPGVLATGSS